MTQADISETIQADPRFAAWAEARRKREEENAAKLQGVHPEPAAEAPKAEEATPVADAPQAPQSVFNLIRVDFTPAEMRLEAPQRPAYAPCRFNLGYDTTTTGKAVFDAHRAVQWWLNDILHGETDRKRWILLFGPSGCGKTHLLKASAACLRAHMPETPQAVQCWNWVKLRDRILSGDCPGLLQQVQKARFLMLDDIGAEYTASEKAAAVSASLLYEILEYRLNKWTFVTSNLAPGHLPDVRLTSRFYRGKNVIADMTTAEDYCYKLYKQQHENA